MTARHKNRPPTPPGEMLAETLSDMGMTQGQLAEKMGIPIQRVNLIINGHRAISAETAILLARAFGVFGFSGEFANDGFVGDLERRGGWRA